VSASARQLDDLAGLVKTQFSVVRIKVSEQLVERSVKPARERSAEELARILTAAESVLARGGFGRLRVDDVLAEAGLSTRAFYRHFRGKAELFVALFDAEMSRAQERLRARLARAGAPEQQVRAWIEATLALAYDPRLARRARLFFVERQTIATDFPEEIVRCVRLLLEPLEAAITTGQEQGVFAGADPERDALAIHHLCSGLMADRLLGTGGLAREQAVALAERFALTTLQGGERKQR
jgi:AcrR family transcriptional regulator